MAVPDWLPGAERHPGQGSGAYLDGAAWKLLLHTTEGPTLLGALSALDAKRAWSHFVYDPNTDHLVQCIPLNQAARALRSGGSAGKTNGARVIQVEIVGTAATTPHWTAQVNANVGRLIARLAAVVPFRPVFDLPFYGADAGFTVASVNARQRLSWDAWYRYNAICGHQHVPANDHWDPGHINTVAITRSIISPNPEELTVADIEAIMTALGGIKAEQAAQREEQAAQRKILDKLDADLLTKGGALRQTIVHVEKLDEGQAIHDRAAKTALGKP